MTVDQIIQRLSVATRRAKHLLAENQSLWERNREWRLLCSQKTADNKELRRRVRQLEKSRDQWKAQAPRSRHAHWKNIHLSERDLDRIRRMPVR